MNDTSNHQRLRCTFSARAFFNVRWPNENRAWRQPISVCVCVSPTWRRWHPPRATSGVFLMFLLSYRSNTAKDFSEKAASRDPVSSTPCAPAYPRFIVSIPLKAVDCQCSSHRRNGKNGGRNLHYNKVWTALCMCVHAHECTSAWFKNRFYVFNAHTFVARLSQRFEV